MTKKKLLIILIPIIAILITGVIIFIFLRKEDKVSESLFVTIDNAYILGQRFNLNGSFVNLKETPTKMSLVLNKKEYELEFSIEENKVIFSTNNKDNNKVINLDKVSKGTHQLLIKINNKLYSIDTDYQDNFEYYTITKNKTNYKVDININNKINFKVNKTKLPNDYYDIVLDVGHGGRQPGAVFNDIIEKEHTLIISKLLKEELESLGYKVILTRDGDYLPGGEDDPYGEEGRVSFAYFTKAKYYFSIHLNSTDSTEDYHGTEIYASNLFNLELAKSIVDNVVKVANTDYSNRTKNKVDNGIYIKHFSQEDIDYLNEEAKKNNEKEPNISLDTQYYFAVRETGGSITGAFKEENPYYQFKHGAEGYLVELGYIPSSKDNQIILNTPKLYAQGVAEGINNYLKNQ